MSGDGGGEDDMSLSNNMTATTHIGNSEAGSIVDTQHQTVFRKDREENSFPAAAVEEKLTTATSLVSCYSHTRFAASSAELLSSSSILLSACSPCTTSFPPAAEDGVAAASVCSTQSALASDSAGSSSSSSDRVSSLRGSGMRRPRGRPRKDGAPPQPRPPPPLFKRPRGRPRRMDYTSSQKAVNKLLVSSSEELPHANGEEKSKDAAATEALVCKVPSVEETTKSPIVVDVQSEPETNAKAKSKVEGVPRTEEAAVSCVVVEDSVSTESSCVPPKGESTQEAESIREQREHRGGEVGGRSFSATTTSLQRSSVCASTSSSDGNNDSTSPDSYTPPVVEAGRTGEAANGQEEGKTVSCEAHDAAGSDVRQKPIAQVTEQRGLPNVESGSDEAIRRKRGRPRKPKVESTDGNSLKEDGTAPVVGKRPRGRPRKSVEVKSDANQSDASLGQYTTGRLSDLLGCYSGGSLTSSHCSHTCADTVILDNATVHHMVSDSTDALTAALEA